MKKITPPIRSGDQGSVVANLHEALEVLGFPISNRGEKSNQQYGAATAQAVTAFKQANRLDSTGDDMVDEVTAAVMNGQLTERGLLEAEEIFSVSGQVAQPEGAGIAGLSVRVFDKCLAKEKLLGEAVTGANGEYRIDYSPDKLINPARKQADLLVRVFAAGGELKATAPLIINALTEEVVNMVVGEESYRGRDLYTRVHEGLADYLEGVDLEEIQPRDLYCLANNTAMDVEWVHHYIRARQMEKESGLFSAQAFFAWFRSGTPVDLGALLGRSREELRSSIERAVGDNLAPRAVLANLEKLETNLVQWRSNYVISANNRPVTHGSLGQLLAASKLNQSQQRQITHQWQTYEGEAAGFWQDQKHKLGDSLSRDLNLTLQLGALTRNHLPLINVLKGRRDFREFADVARFTQEDWIRLFETANLDMPPHIEGEDLAARRQAYAGALTRFTELLMPTRVLANAFSRDEAVDSEQLDRFFAENPDFEFRHQSIRNYLEENPGALAGFADEAAVRAELEGLQRIFHLSPAVGRYEVAKVLWQNQLHSAWAITLRGEEEFMGLFGGEERIGKEVFKQAQKTQQINHAVMLQQLDQQNAFGYVMPKAKAQVNGIPDLESLFGAQGYCECRHCLSFFSPSAYLVDLFLYLQKARLDGNASGRVPDTVLEKLFQRRPDLANIELDCENAMTSLPYIDLVNEILENAVLPRAYTNTGIKIGNRTITLPAAIAEEPVPQTEADEATLKAWEKVELDIYNTEGVEEMQKSVLLLPLVHNRRLCLFWPVFTFMHDDPNEEERRRIEELEKQIKNQEEELDKLTEFIAQSPLNEESYLARLAILKFSIINKTKELEKIEQGHSYYSLKMVWSQYRQGHWTAKKNYY